MRSWFLFGSLLLLTASAPAMQQYRFDQPIDALSIGFVSSATSADVSAWEGTQWSPWYTVERDEEDPTVTESTLVMFKESVSLVRIRGASVDDQLHPIRVSHDPVHYTTASTDDPGPPHILSRSDWGADESLTIGDKIVTEAELNAVMRSDQVPSRTVNCAQLQKNYPDEFTVTKTVSTAPDGKPYSWPIQYSPSIKLFVIHHTADQVTGETRSAVERMRAIYQYHAKSRGWGDIGYNYVVDEDGQIYEGRQGGDDVVGGHAFCYNVGTMGIALMGNTDTEKPTQEQIHSLQSLLVTLSQKYSVDLTKNVTFHGRDMPPVVGHGDLMGTRCPGYYVRGVLDQIRDNARTGKVSADVRFPPPPPAAIDVSSSAEKQPRSIAIGTNGIFIYPSADVTGHPGDIVQLDFQFQASNMALAQRTKIGSIKASDPRFQVWQATEFLSTRLVNDLLLPAPLSANASVALHLRVQLPPDAGEYQLKVGSILYAVHVGGTPAHVVSTKVGEHRLQRELSKPLAAAETAAAQAPYYGPTIRIRLLRNEATFAKGSLTVGIPHDTYVNSVQLPAGDLLLSMSDTDCRAERDGQEIAKGIVRINPGDVFTKVSAFPRGENQFRGVLECRVIDGKLALINELPLDRYLLGLGEEPDSEPYEKQRAFAVAARSYAAYYLDQHNRKFPGQPYDGSDSPDSFQKYAGASFETKNPQWVKAVTSTANQVLMTKGDIIKPPYFSSDDGRTRSPQEANWKNFPNADVFASKPDPWCTGMSMQGHGVGMSGCGAAGQANEGKTAEQILSYYYPGVQEHELTRQ